MSVIKGVLLDVDGVLHVSGQPIEGAAETLKRLRRAGLSLRFLTNTTTKKRSSLCDFINNMGFEIAEEELFSAAFAGVTYLQGLEDPTCFFVLSKDTLEEYASFAIDEVNPDVVVIGDVGSQWDFALMNKLFRMVMQGAKILALHKGRYFQVHDGFEMDTGAFVAGLEYAASTEAIVVGKPNPLFFDMARKSMGLPSENLIMVGDDLNNDVAGAQNLNIPGLLVRTGKFRPHLLEKSEVQPDAIIDSIAALPDWLGI